MKTQSVQSDQWRSYFDQFSRLHKGQPVRIATIAKEVGVQMNARNLPLIGITVEREPTGNQSIELSAGRSPNGPHVAHTIGQATQVYVAEWNNGCSAAVDIVTSDGWTTLIQIGPSKEMLEPGFITQDVMRHDHVPDSTSQK